MAGGTLAAAACVSLGAAARAPLCAAAGGPLGGPLAGAAPLAVAEGAWAGCVHTYIKQGTIRFALGKCLCIS